MEGQIQGWSSGLNRFMAWRRRKENQTYADKTLGTSSASVTVQLQNFRLSGSFAGWGWQLISLLNIAFFCSFGCHPSTTASWSGFSIAVAATEEHRLFKNHHKCCCALFLPCTSPHKLRQNVTLMSSAMCLFAWQHPASNCLSAVHNCRQRTDWGNMRQQGHN